MRQLLKYMKYIHQVLPTMMKTSTRPLWIMSLLLLTISVEVEGLFDASQHFPGRLGLGLRGRSETASRDLATVKPPPVPHQPLGFLAGFDMEKFGAGVKDFAIGGVAGVCCMHNKCDGRSLLHGCRFKLFVNFGIQVLDCARADY